MNSTLRKQDMPPSGGYSPIVYKRIPPKGYFNGYGMIALYLGVTAASLGLYALTFKRRSREEIEMRSSRFAIVPLLLAERDREFLKQLRLNRDAETELMKNVKGWEVGTLDGEPLYTATGDDFLSEPTGTGFYAHTSVSEFKKRFRVHMMV